MDNNAPESKASTTSTDSKSTPSIQNSQTAPSKPNSRKAATKTKKVPFGLIILIILLCGSVLASGYLWQELEKQALLIQQLNKQEIRLDNNLGSINKNLTNRLNTLEQNSARQAELITTLDKLALFNTKELNRLHASNRSDWLLAEAEYLLRLGNQRVNIERDVKGAEAIFMAADKVLNEIEDPSIYPIREALAQEVLALQSVNKVDLDGIYLQLQALINALDTMNEASLLRSEQIQTQSIDQPSKAEAQTESDLIMLWKSIWADLKTALVIRRLDAPVAPLLAPEQSYFLKQNLRLILEQAGLAVLNEDHLTFQQNIDKAIHWINQYFALNDPASGAMKRTLDTLKQHNITRQMPDVSLSLRLLKTRIEAMYRAHQLDRNTSLQVEQKEQQEQKIVSPSENAAQPTESNQEPTAL